MIKFILCVQCLKDCHIRACLKMLFLSILITLRTQTPIPEHTCNSTTWQPLTLTSTPMTSQLVSTCCHLTLGLRLLSLKDPTSKQEEDSETILPPNYLVNAITWDFDKELKNTLSYVVLAECLQKKI